MPDLPNPFLEFCPTNNDEFSPALKAFLEDSCKDEGPAPVFLRAPTQAFLDALLHDIKGS